jgi:hypothetical protein
MIPNIVTSVEPDEDRCEQIQSMLVGGTRLGLQLPRIGPDMALFLTEL